MATTRQFPDLSLTGRVVVVPAVSIGSTGQRCLDLLAETGRVQGIALGKDDSIQRQGIFRSVSLRPFCGSSMAASGMLGPAEVFATSGTGPVLVQQRAHCIPGQEDTYVKSVVAWAREGGAAGILVLGGCDAAILPSAILDLAHRGRVNAIRVGNSLAADVSTLPDWWAAAAPPGVIGIAPSAAADSPVEASAAKMAEIGSAGVDAGVGVATGYGSDIGAGEAKRGGAASAAPGALSDTWHWSTAPTSHGETPTTVAERRARAARAAEQLAGLSLTGLTHRYLRLAEDFPCCAMLTPVFADSDGVTGAASLALVVSGLLGSEAGIKLTLRTPSDASGELMTRPKQDLLVAVVLRAIDTTADADAAKSDAAAGTGPVFAMPEAWRTTGIRGVVRTTQGTIRAVSDA